MRANVARMMARPLPPPRVNGRASRAGALRACSESATERRPKECACGPHTPSKAHYDHGCRCGGCREAKRMADRAYRSRRRASGPAIAHGTRQGYLDHCRCEACTEAGRAYQRTYDRARFAAFNARYPHGSRARALLGCRCIQCQGGPPDARTGP